MRWRARGFVLACLALVGCLPPTIPESNQALRVLPMTSSADLAAHAQADGAHLTLNEWCGEAVKQREAGEELVPEDPLVDGRAVEQVEFLRTAIEKAESEELTRVLAKLLLAHQARLEILTRDGKHKPKKYLDAERKVAELGFGLRRWRMQL